jgi:hypothetical protein
MDSNDAEHTATFSWKWEVDTHERSDGNPTRKKVC